MVGNANSGRRADPTNVVLKQMNQPQSPVATSKQNDGFMIPNYSGLKEEVKKDGGAIGISSGGTNATTQVTNGVNYFNGTSITSDSYFGWDGTNIRLGIGTLNPTASFEIMRNYGGFTGANTLANVKFSKADGTNKVRFDWHDTYGTDIELRNGVSTSGWIGALTYTNYSSSFFDKRIALFQVLTGESEAGSGNFFIVTHSDLSDSFNYSGNYLYNGSVVLGSTGGNDVVLSPPTAKVWLRGNVAIGTDAYAATVPDDGLYIQGDTNMDGVIQTVGGNSTYTGDLNDSNSTKIADVVGGLITAVYY